MNKTVIISCAGCGSRLGMNIPKCLLDIGGQPLIIRQLEQLKELDDIRIIVGYQADKVIETAQAYREDIKFFYNNDWETTGTAASFSKGLPGAHEMVIALDGDLLVNPKDMADVLAESEECICGCNPTTEDPVLMTLNEEGQVIRFSREEGTLEWTGLAQVRRDRLSSVQTRHVYQILEPLLPIAVKVVDTREIDTPADLTKALSWWKELSAHKQKEVTARFFKKQEQVEDRYLAARFHKNERLAYDENLIKQYICPDSRVLDLGCGTGLLEDVLHKEVRHIVAVDSSEEFLKKAVPYENVDFLVGDATTYTDNSFYDLILAYGITIYMDDDGLLQMLKNIFSMLNSDGVLVLKNQWGVENRLVVDGYSEGLGSDYYAIYRSLDEIKLLLAECGFSFEVVDIYPEYMNLWKNTHEYAFICKKCDL